MRAAGLEGLTTALRDARAYGGTTVLLVVGVVNKEISYADAYKRTQEEIRKALPLAEERQIKIGRWQSMPPEQQAASIRHMIEEHLTPDEFGKMAARAGVKTVVLTHLPTTADPKDDYKRFGEQVKKYFSGQVLIAKDLMEF